MDSRIKLNIFGIKLTLKNPFENRNNHILLNKNGKVRKLRFVKGLKVKFYGGNNKIEFYEKIPKMKNVRIECGDNTSVSIGKSKYRIKNLYINARAENVKVNIGEDFSIESGKFDFHGEPNTSINIGNDCQFGCNIALDTADGHTIFDKNTKQALNNPQSINISNHVWLCENVSVLKGANIPENCVVGKNSLVCKNHTDSNNILAGCPAKTVKTEIDWTRKANKEY